MDAATRLYRETEGNPLFIVETVRAESGGGPPGVPEQRDPGLPPRAHAVIAGRLAQLSDHAREIAAAAAVIGRAFDLTVLVRLVGDEEVVARALDELWRKRIVREQGPNAYDFTHDKLRDVAYGETSAPQRRRLHRRVAEALVASHEKDLDPVSAQIAAHYESAGLPEQAIPHYARAAVVAQGVYAHDEAIALVGRGLSLLRELPASARRDGSELELQLVLAPSYRVTMGWAAPELGAVLDRALALCDRVGTGAQRAQILYGMQSLYIVGGPAREVRADHRRDGARLPRDARARSRRARPSRCWRGSGSRWAASRRPATTSTSLVREADPSQLQRLQESQGLNYEVARPGLAIARALVPGPAGHGPRARVRRPAPRARARAAVQPGHRRDLPRPAPAAPRRSRRRSAGRRRRRSSSRRSSRRPTTARGPPSSSPTRETLGRPEATALDAAARRDRRASRRRGRGFACRTTSRCWRTPTSAPARPDAGLDVVEEALSAAGRRTSAGGTPSCIACARSCCWRSGAEPAEAEAALRRALEIARGQQARSLELRAALALAGLWAASGRPPRRESLLAPLHASFTEGLETPDLVAARALLSRLG